MTGRTLHPSLSKWADQIFHRRRVPGSNKSRPPIGWTQSKWQKLTVHVPTPPWLLEGFCWSLCRAACSLKMTDKEKEKKNKPWWDIMNVDEAAADIKLIECSWSYGEDRVLRHHSNSRDDGERSLACSCCHASVCCRLLKLAWRCYWTASSFSRGAKVPIASAKPAKIATLF